MGGIFGGGAQSVSTSSPIITSVRIQTSAYGTPIPLVYGRTRIAPNLLDYTDFTATPHTTTTSGGGGKGGGGASSSNTTYTYTAATLFAIAQGPIHDVPMVFVGKNKRSLASLNLSLFSGTMDQAPFGYMTSKHPAQALAYPGLAYAASGAYDLGDNAELGNHNFEVIGNPEFRFTAGGGKSIRKVILAQGGQPYNRVAAADLQWSDDGETYVTAAALTLTNTAAAQTFIIPESGDHPYWRLIARSDPVGFRGEFSLATVYAPGDCVASGGGYWRCVSAVKGVVPARQVAKQVTSSGEDGNTYTTTVYVGSWVELSAADLRWSLATVYFYDSVSTKAKPVSTVDRFEGAYRNGYPARYAFDGVAGTEWRSSEQGGGVKDVAWIGQYFGVWDVNIADIIPDVIGNTRYGAGFPLEYLGDLSLFRTYCAAAGLLISPSYVEQKPGNEVLQRLVEIGNSEIVNSEGLLKIIPYGDSEITGNGVTYSPDLTPVAYLDYDDFLPDDGEDPVRLIRGNAADAFNHVQVKFYNRSNSYATEPADAKDSADIELNGVRDMDVLEYYEICDAGVAQQVADLRLGRVLHVRNTYEFNLGWRYCRLEPMDIVALTEPFLKLNRTPVRIVEVEEDEDGRLSVVAEDLIMGASSVPVVVPERPGGYDPDYNIMPGSVVDPVFVNAPGALTVTGFELWLAVAGPSQYWGGCQVWVSFDGESYKQAGSIYGAARFGVLTEPLVSGADPDTSGVLSVDMAMSGGNTVLQSASQSDVDNLVTLCKIDGELLAYRDATLTGSAQYDLTYLRRGAYNSTRQTHMAGSTFVRLDDALFKYAYDPALAGKPIWVKLPSFNIWNGGRETIDQVPAYQTILGASASYPPDVDGFAAAQNGDAVLFQWKLRPESTVVGYEIRFNMRGVYSWDDATPVTRATRGTQITTVKVPPGSWTFLIAAKDTSGNYSQVKASYDLEVTNYNVVIYEREESEYWECGTLSNLVIHFPSRKLVPASMSLAAAAGWETFDSFCPYPYEQGSYESVEIDLGLEGDIRSYGISSAALGPGEAGISDPEVYIDSRKDAGSYNGFQIWGIGTFPARYIKQRVVLYRDRGLCALASFKITIDAEKRTEEFLAVPVDAAGTSFLFARPFFTTPTITVSPVSVSAAYANITAQSRYGYSAKAFNSAGTAIAGTVNVTAKGA